MNKIAVTTRSFTNSRDGANLSETVLTNTAVGTKGIQRILTMSTHNDARGCEAQPLLVPNVTMESGEVKDLVILATMANGIYAYEAGTDKLQWMKRLNRPIKGTRAIDGYLINDYWGILSTPVINTQNSMLYVVAWSSPDETPQKSSFALYEIDIASGQVMEELDLSTATYNPGNGLPVQKFSSAARKQRCSLLLDHGYVYIGFGTIAETSKTAQGWIIAVNIGTMDIDGAITTTSRGSGAGLWQAGQGLVADANGDIYGMTGNGDFDGITDFGESFFKIGWLKNKLVFKDWWSPFSDAGREGRDPTAHPVAATSKLAKGKFGHLSPTGVDLDNDDDDDDDKNPAPTNIRSYAAMDMGGYDDMDLGSGGPLLIEELKLIIGAGKDGIVYVLNKDNMGKTKPQDFANPAANNAKLACPPNWFTYFPGFDKSPGPQKFTDLNFLYQGKTHHQHSTPVYYKSAKNGRLLFTMGENERLRVWRINDNKSLTYLACGNEYASAAITWTPGGMPGGMLSLSANGNKDGILWASIPIGDGNTTVTQGRLIAYDAENIVNGTIRKLWDSADWGIQYVYNKFNIPLVANGVLYVPNYSGGVDVYGLANG